MADDSMVWRGSVFMVSPIPSGGGLPAGPFYIVIVVMMRWRCFPAKPTQNRTELNSGPGLLQPEWRNIIRG
jgi:hypothetical protein